MPLPELRERIAAAVSEKVLAKVLAGEQHQHYNHGWKSDCDCNVCEFRRRYVRTMERGGGYMSELGSYFSFREQAKDANRAFKRSILDGEGSA